MRLYSVSLRLSLSLLLTLPRLVAQTAFPAAAILEGDVFNAADNTPIAGARAKLRTGQNEPIYIKADKQGHFEFTNLVPGSYSLSVQSPGFLDASNAPVNLQAPRPTALVGSVRTTNPPASAISGISGIVSIPPALPAPTVTRSTDPDGTVRANARVPLTAYSVVTGKITDPDGVPMANTAVEILMKRPAQPPTAQRASFGATVRVGDIEVSRQTGGTTNDKGDFRIGRLQPGTYFLVVNKADGGGQMTWQSNFRTTYFPAATDPASAKPIEVTSGQQLVANIQLVRQSGVRVAGKFIFAPELPSPIASTGNLAIPRTYTNVAIVPVGTPLMNSSAGFTGGPDKFELKDVLPGKYTLMALTRETSSDPFGGNQKEVAGAMRAIEIGSKDQLDLDLDIQPFRDLPGIVTFSEGCKPVPITIRAGGYSPLGGKQITVTSGTDGKFVLTGLTTGTASIGLQIASSPGQRIPGQTIRRGTRDVFKDGLEVPFTGDEPLRIEIDCSISGRLQ